jgi:pimeloyl-ACP methyl ester carboxylesterase
MSGEAGGSYAEVNGLKMYYEIHGTGLPLVVLHGAFMTIGAMGAIVAALAEARQVIAVELQGHGRTADVDRPFSYEQMAEDVAALIRHLGIERADVFGYSLGGGVAFQLAMRHPELVRKLVVASASSTSDGVHPEVWEGIEQITPELFAGTPWKEEYDRVAPNPDAFPTLVEKMKQLDSQPFTWPPDEIRVISAPTMVMIGDSDGTTPEHAVELFRLRGGGVFGDLAGLPSARLAVLPGTTHVGLIHRTDWLAPMIGEFLDAPIS